MKNVSSIQYFQYYKWSKNCICHAPDRNYFLSEKWWENPGIVDSFSQYLKGKDLRNDSSQENTPSKTGFSSKLIIS